MMPIMIFHGLSISLSSKSFFPEIRALCVSLLAAVLAGCIYSSKSQHIDYIAHPTPPKQVAQLIQPTLHVQPSLRLQPSPSSHADATCASASNFQSDMLSRVNSIRAAGAVCGGQRYPAAAPLRWNSKLQHAAAVHSNDMADHNFFNHKSATNGTTLPERLRSVGYRYQAAGENIGAGPATVAQVVDMCVASPGHCVTLMTANFVDLGASCKNNNNSYYKTYWTLKAATPS
jgi:uncharacterized protein YkwD